MQIRTIPLSNQAMKTRRLECFDLWDGVGACKASRGIRARFGLVGGGGGLFWCEGVWEGGGNIIERLEENVKG